MSNNKAPQPKVTVLVDAGILQRIWAEQRRVKDTTGFQVSQSQIVARLLDKHLPMAEAVAEVQQCA